MLTSFVSIDPAKNRYRTYTIAVQPTLFAPYALVRTWGRIGARPQMRVQEMPQDKAIHLAEREIIRRLRRGYRLLGGDG